MTKHLQASPKCGPPSTPTRNALAWRHQRDQRGRTSQCEPFASFVGVAVAALLLTISTVPAQASRTLLHIEIADAHVSADRSVKVRLFYSCPGGSDPGVEGNASLWVFQLRDGIFIRSVTADSLFDSMTCDGTNRLLVQTFRRDTDGRRFIADLPLNVSASFNLDIPDLEEALSREEKTFPPGGSGPLVDQDILIGPKGRRRQCCTRSLEGVVRRGSTQP